MQLRYNQYNLEALFKKSLVAEKVSANTIKNYLSDLRHFLGWLQSKSFRDSNKPLVIPRLMRDPENMDSCFHRNDTEMLKQVQHNTIIKYKNYLLSNLPLKTVNRRLSTLRKFFSFCISQGWMKENPAKQVQNTRQGEGERMKGEVNTKKLNSFSFLLSPNFVEYLKTSRLGEADINSIVTDVKEFLDFAGKSTREVVTRSLL